MKFLVVDINTTTSYRIKKLVNENIDILVATSSFEAINRLTNHIDIDLVIIDVKLGAEDGYEFRTGFKSRGVRLCFKAL
jgi:CheY-like chemotaxis protein